MANVDQPAGFRFVRRLGGGSCTIERFFIPATDSTAVFLGDAVKSAGSADADGVRTVAQAAAGNTILGVVVGFEPNRDDLTKQYRPASTARYVYVNTDPYAVYAIQEDSDTSTLAAADVGNNCDIVVGTGSTTTGMSAMEIDSSTKNTTTAQVRLLALSQKSDNAIGTNAEWEVMINEHEYKTTTGT